MAETGTSESNFPRWAKGITLVIGAATAFVIVLSVRKAIKNKPPKVQYPNGGLGIPAGFNAEAYAIRAHDLMTGPALLSPTRDMFMVQIGNLATDDMFVAVYDVFNQKYMQEGDGTLRNWINKEYSLPGGLVKLLNARFERLNLK